MDFNGDGKIDEREMVEFFSKTNVIQGISQTHVKFLFNYLDSN